MVENVIQDEFTTQVTFLNCRMAQKFAFLLFLPTIHSLLHTTTLQQLQHSKSHICEPGQPELVYIGNNLTEPLDNLLKLYLLTMTEPKTIVTNVNDYLWMISYALCPLMFVENEYLATEFQYISEHMKLIVTSAEAFDSLNAHFIEYQIYDTVFLVLDESQLIVYHYNHFLRKQNQWMTLDSNPMIEAARDLNGFEFVADSNNAMEETFAEFITTNINATPVQHARSIGLLYSHQMFVFGRLFNHIYMHRTAGLRVVVPRLLQAKPMIFVLVDPYDIETWMTYGVMILASAFLRMFCSQRYGFQQYVTSLQDIIACVVLSSPITFYRLLEQLILGVFKLLSMVLMTAYESLVISFLLNPRFYPELNTIQQINDSCCWALSDDVMMLNFQHFDDCRSVFYEEHYVPSVQDQGRFSCYLVNPTFEKELKDLMAHDVIAKQYRWSKVQVQPYPVMAVAFGSVGLVRRTCFYAGVYFAEGALFRVYEFDEKRSGMERHRSDRPVTIEDLSLLWVVHLVGIGLSMIAFAGEMAVRKMKVVRCTWMNIIRMFGRSRLI
uniref:ionotropic receptor 113 n=1 Tax=Aedes aegypti TaxID=7159 RepID=UPI000C2F8162|nr:ionotropic receptor 113 [Aedes aegypti]